MSHQHISQNMCCSLQPSRCNQYNRKIVGKSTTTSMLISLIRPQMGLGTKGVPHSESQKFPRWVIAANEATGRCYTRFIECGPELGTFAYKETRSCSSSCGSPQYQVSRLSATVII